MKRIATFGLLSLGGTAAHYLLLLGWVELAGLGAWTGSVAGAALGLVINYLLHARITFAQPLSWRGFGRFTLSGIAGFIVNAAVMAAGLQLGLVYLAAQLIATLASFVANYLLAQFWVFRPPPDDREPS